MSAALLAAGLCGVCVSARANGAQQSQRLTRPSAQTSAVQGEVRDAAGRPVGGAKIVLQAAAGGQTLQTATTADGIFRFRDVTAGVYKLTIEKEGLASFSRESISIAASEIVTMEVRLQALTAPASAQRPPQEPGA
ncbi:MAG: carboxypeptidase-like regulatory domain-containing protein, partial [Candidatus Acidiferrales bacterium]